MATVSTGPCGVFVYARSKSIDGSSERTLVSDMTAVDSCTGELGLPEVFSFSPLAVLDSRWGVLQDSTRAVAPQPMDEWEKGRKSGRNQACFIIPFPAAFPALSIFTLGTDSDWRMFSVKKHRGNQRLSLSDTIMEFS